MANKGKKKEPRELDPRELEAQLREGQEKMFRLKFQMSMGQTDPVKRIRELRKDRARLLTVQRQRELEAAGVKA